MASQHRRRIVIDSDEEEEDVRVLQTPATKCTTNATISASARTIDKAISLAVTRNDSQDSQDRRSRSDSSGEWRDYSEEFINVMHGDADEDDDSDVYASVTRNRSSKSYGERAGCKGSSSLMSVDSKDEIEKDEYLTTEAPPRAPTPQFTTTAAHAARTAHALTSASTSSRHSSSPATSVTSNTPPSCQAGSSRRSSRLAKGPSQDKVDLRRKLNDLRELRNRSKNGIGALHDSSSGSEDMEIRSMAAKHQRDSRQRNKQRASRLDQYDEGGGSSGSGEESDKRVTRRFGHNQVISEEDERDPYDMDDMNNFIVDDDEVEEEYIASKTKSRGGSKKGRSSRSRSRSKSASSPRDGTMAMRGKRRVRCDSDSDSEGGSDDAGAERETSCGAQSKPLKRHRLEPVLQVVPERKRKRRIDDNDDDEEDEEEGEREGDECNMEEDGASEDSAAVDHRRQRKKGKVQKYTSCAGGAGGIPSDVISPLAAAVSSKRHNRNKKSNSTKTKIQPSNRKIVHDDEEDEESSVYEASSEGESVSGEESDCSGSESESGSSDEERDVDGFSMYRQLDLMQQEHEDAEAPTSIFRKSLSVSEALGVYIDLLLSILTDADYCRKYGESTDGALRGKGLKVSQAEKERIQKHHSAARSVENLICTSRESLLGSSVWKGEFFRELTTRPFYDVKFHDCCSGSSSGQRGRDDRGKERGLERCDACGRESKSAGGYKLHLFGPAYDASGLWSSRRWISKIPPAILNSVLPFVKASARSLAPATTPSSSKKSTGGGKEGTAHVSYSHRRGSGTGSTSHLTPGHRQQLAAAETFKSDVKRMLHLQGNLHQHQDDCEEHEQEREEGLVSAMSSPTVALSSALLQRVSISGNPASYSSPAQRQRRVSRAFSDDSNVGDSDNAVFAASDGEKEMESVNTPWWQRKWGKDLAAEPETEWVVNSHCKRRTQMYHSLLHYKFRLILKIRERVRQKALKLGPLSPGQGECGEETVSAVLAGGFVAAEVRRFESLLAEAGQQFGGEEHSKFSIWSDDEDTPVKTSGRNIANRKSSSTSAKGGSSTRGGSGNSGGSSGGRTRRGPTLDAWLTFTPSSDISRR